MGHSHQTSKGGSELGPASPLIRPSTQHAEARNTHLKLPDTTRPISSEPKSLPYVTYERRGPHFGWGVGRWLRVLKVAPCLGLFVAFRVTFTAVFPGGRE